MAWYNTAKDKAEHLWKRSLDKHVRIAVTGLSGAGKTAFITSLINQLLHSSSEHHLSFFSPCRQRRVKASRLVMHKELSIPAFNYQGSMDSLTGVPPYWPESTRTISQAEINCRFTVKDKWLRKLSEDSTISVEILDYPGEWLLDLPILNLSFKQWSHLCLKYLKSDKRKEYVGSVLSDLSSLDFQSMIDGATEQKQLDIMAQEYKDGLLEYRSAHHDYSLALPGRFILPGELQGTPALSFFPVLNLDILELDWEQFEANSLLKVLEARFNYYKSKIIQPFFDDYFATVDRQIVLIDTTSVLQSNYESYQDLKYTMEKLLEGFSYGRANWLQRLFAPSIDKLMIATTKADLVPPDQHQSLESFMQKMITQAKNQVGYEGVEVETMAIASIATSEPVATEYNGEQLLCVQGLDAESRDSVIHYPGKVPAKTLTRSEWNELDIDFSPFALPDLNQDDPLPHIRMDKVLQFLIGDKFI